VIAAPKPGSAMRAFSQALHQSKWALSYMGSDTIPIEAARPCAHDRPVGGASSRRFDGRK